MSYKTLFIFSKDGKHFGEDWVQDGQEFIDAKLEASKALDGRAILIDWKTRKIIAVR